MSNDIRFIFDIIAIIDGIEYSTEFIDIDVSMSESKDEQRSCEVTLFMPNEQTVASLSKPGKSVEIYIQQHPYMTREKYYKGTTQYAHYTRIGEDELIFLRCDEGSKKAKDAVIAANCAPGLAMIEHVKKIVSQVQGVTLKDGYPVSLNQPHPSGKSIYSKGTVDFTIKEFIGPKYEVRYCNSVIEIFESKGGNNGRSTVINSDSLYDIPKVSMDKESVSKTDKDNFIYRKSYQIKALPNPGFIYGSRLMIEDSKFIDRKYFFISNVNFSFNKFEMSSSFSLKEKLDDDQPDSDTDHGKEPQDITEEAGG